MLDGYTTLLVGPDPTGHPGDHGDRRALSPTGPPDQDRH